MLWLLTIALIIVVLVLAFRAKPRDSHQVWPFYAKKPLSNPEQVLYFRLTKALPEHIVLAQVQLSRFLGVEKGNNYQSWINRINRMSADYVICGKDSKVLVVIELDDVTHDTERRRKADQKKDKAIKSAGLKIHRWNVKDIPDEAMIQKLVLAQVINSDESGLTYS